MIFKPVCRNLYCNFTGTRVLKNDNDSFLRKNYPFVLIVVGFFLVFFPFDLIGASALGDLSVFLYGFTAVLVMGFVSYYKKRKEYALKTRKIVKISALTIPLFFVAAVLAGAAMGVGSAFFTLSLEPTKNFDTDLIEKRVLDWVNTQRVQNNVSGVNLDVTLNSLAEIRSLEMIRTSPEDGESISNININEIAKRDGIKCMINGISANIHDYVLLFPPKSYLDMEKTVDHTMTYLINEEEFQNIVFASNATRTGIDSFVVGDDLFVVQTFC